MNNASNWWPMLSALIVAVPVAWLTAHFALRNSRLDKWWERKAAAYEKVIGAVEQLHSNASLAWENEARAREPTEADIDELEKWESSLREVRRAFHTAGYLLSADVTSALAEYLRASRTTPSD